MRGVYIQRHNKVAILPMGKLWLKVYDPKRSEEDTLVAQDVLYGNHTELATYRFIKKYLNLGWDVTYVDKYHDEYPVIAVYY